MKHCIACGSERPDVCELLGHVYPIAPRPSMHLDRPAAAIAAPAEAPAVAPTREHYQLLFPLDNPALAPMPEDFSDAEWL